MNLQRASQCLFRFRIISATGAAPWQAPCLLILTHRAHLAQALAHLQLPAPFPHQGRLMLWD